MKSKKGLGLWKMFLMVNYITGIAGNVHTIQYNLSVMTEIITTVFQRLQSRQVVLLYNLQSDFQEISLLNELLQMIGNRSIPTALISFKAIHMFSHKLKRTLCVMLVNNSEFQYLFLKLSTNNLQSTKLLAFVNKKYRYFINTVNISRNCLCRGSLWLNNNILLAEVYCIRSNYLLQQYAIATFTLNGRQNIWPTDEQLKISKHPQNLSVKAVTAIKRDKETGRLDGFYGELWSIFKEKLKLREHFLVAEDDSSYGAQTANGSWNGMIGMLVRKEADIGIGGFAMTSERIEAVDFLAPMVKGSVTVYIKRPELDTFTSSWILKPFSTKLWIILMVIIILLSLELYAVWNINITQHDILQTVQHSSWLYIHGSFCQQGQLQAVHSDSSRVLYFTSYLTAVTIFAAYAATFTSFLMVQHVTIPFSSFEDLLKDGTYNLGVLANSATLNYFDKSNNEFMQQIYRKLIAPEKDSLPTSNEEGLKRICKRKRYAFLSPTKTAVMTVHGLHCNIIPVSGANIPATSSMVVSKHSPLRQLLNQCLQQMRRSGILRRIDQNTLSKKLEDNQEASHVAVQFANIAPLLIYLATAMVLSVLILFAELIC